MSQEQTAPERALPRGRRGRTRLRLERLERDEDWERILRSAPGATGFHGLPWLRSVAPLLSLRFLPLAVADGEQICGIVPLLLRSGAITTAPSLPFPYVGPLAPEGRMPEVLALLRRFMLHHGIVKADVQEGPNAGQPAGAALTGAAARVVDETTMALDLRGATQDQLWSQLSKQRRNAVRVSMKRGVEVRPALPGDGALLLPRLLDEAFRARGRASPYPAHVGVWVDSYLRAPVSWLAALTAIREGEPVGMLTSVLGHRAAYGWIGGALREHRDANVASALYWNEILASMAYGFEELDFVGEVDAGVRTFKRSFNAEPWPYRRGTVSPLPTALLSLAASVGRRRPPAEEPEMG